MAHLGFLVQGTGKEEAKGNFGLWDQVKAMEWVNQNIPMFGGDPNQVRCRSCYSRIQSVVLMQKPQNQKFWANVTQCISILRMILVVAVNVFDPT